jgi:hypothetical protein
MELSKFSFAAQDMQGSHCLLDLQWCNLAIIFDLSSSVSLRLWSVAALFAFGGQNPRLFFKFLWLNGRPHNET